MAKKKKQERINLFLGIGTTAKGSGKVGSTGLGALTLQGMERGGKVGSKVDKKELIGPEVYVWFSGSKPVDALIKDLKKLSKDLGKVEKEIKDASARKSPRRINLIVDASGKGEGPKLHKPSKNKRRRRSGKSVKASGVSGSNTGEGR